MPFRSENPIVRVELRSMHTIDTSNAENLFGLWSGKQSPVAALHMTWGRDLSGPTLTDAFASQSSRNARKPWKTANAWRT